MKEELIKEILLIEWDMFKNVSNAGGQAPCQQNLKTFIVMRMSQAMSWTEPMLESYLEDLRKAKDEGRNLMTEKYARMMKYTYPEEYYKLMHRLPILSEEAILLAERITELMLEWVKEIKQKYPIVTGAGRPLERTEGSSYNTSIETYTRGEFLTYGIKTLRLSWDYFSKCKSKGINNYEMVLKNTVKLYGYDSMQQAEEDAMKRTLGTITFLV
ncbi:MAG: DUF4125 family protein [Solirubrobacterales bacterium]